MDLIFLFPHLTRSRNVTSICVFLPISTPLPSPLAWSLHGPSLLALTLCGWRDHRRRGWGLAPSCQAQPGGSRPCDPGCLHSCRPPALVLRRAGPFLLPWHRLSLSCPPPPRPLLSASLTPRPRAPSTRGVFLEHLLPPSLVEAPRGYPGPVAPEWGAQGPASHACGWPARLSRGNLSAHAIAHQHFWKFLPLLFPALS